MFTFYSFRDPAWLGFPSTSVIKLQLELHYSSFLTLQIPLGQVNHPCNFNYNLILMNSTYMCHSHLACPKSNFSVEILKSLLLALLTPFPVLLITSPSIQPVARQRPGHPPGLSHLLYISILYQLILILLPEHLLNHSSSPCFPVQGTIILYPNNSNDLSFPNLSTHYN